MAMNGGFSPPFFAVRCGNTCINFYDNSHLQSVSNWLNILQGRYSLLI